MVEESYRIKAILVTLSIVCVMSFIGSFASWINQLASPDMIDNRHRWKWMFIVGLIIFVILLLQEPR